MPCKRGLSVSNRTGRSAATGVVSGATTVGNEAGDVPPIRFLGDELDLYAEFQHELVRKVRAHGAHAQHEAWRLNAAEYRERR
jgi:hypothetical protein